MGARRFLILTLACLGAAAGVARSQTSECPHCDSVLIHAGRNQYNFKTEEVYFAEFLRLFELKREELERESAKQDAGGALAIKVLELRVRHKFDRDWERLFAEAIRLAEHDLQYRWARVEASGSVVNGDAVREWGACVRDCQVRRGLLAPSIGIEVKGGTDTVALTASAPGPLELARPKIVYREIRGGSFAGQGWELGHDIPPHGVDQLIQRAPGQELVVLLRTDRRGDAVLTLPAAVPEVEQLRAKVEEQQAEIKQLRDAVAAVRKERDTATKSLADSKAEVERMQRLEAVVELIEHPENNGAGRRITRSLPAFRPGVVEFNVHKTHVDGDPGWFFEGRDDISYFRLRIR